VPCDLRGPFSKIESPLSDAIPLDLLVNLKDVSYSSTL